MCAKLLIALLAIIGVGAGAFFWLGESSSSTALQFDEVQSITIEDHWSGLSRAAPIEADYTLAPNGDSFNGTASFSVGSWYYEETNGFSDNADISIPEETIDDFLNRLEDAELRSGQYEPNIEWTDDYPSITITIDTGTEVITYYTGSQGEEHIPWGATYRGESYVIDSGLPAQALALLEPYLHQEILDGLIEQANNP